VWGDRSDYTVDVFENLIVPEAQDFVALAFQKTRALGVIGSVLGMLTAIGFNDELCRVRAIIREIAAHWDLLAEFHVREGFA